jgi:hypothetical protein
MAKNVVEGHTIVVNSRKGCVFLPKVGMLKPGANVVETDLLKAARDKTKGNPKKGKKSSWPRCLTADVEAPVGTAGRSLLDAETLVKNTFDVEMLKAYSDGDNRPEIRDAIEKQIQIITQEPEDDEKDGD